MPLLLLLLLLLILLLQLLLHTPSIAFRAGTTTATTTTTFSDFRSCKLPELHGYTTLEGRGTLYLRAAVRRRCQRPPKGFGTTTTEQAT